MVFKYANKINKGKARGVFVAGMHTCQIIVLNCILFNGFDPLPFDKKH